jgi:uncharacterized membrane protein
LLLVGGGIMARRRKGDTDKALELVLWIIAIIVIMPFVGYRMLSSNKKLVQLLGLCVLCFGVVIWIFVLTEVLGKY